MDNFYLTLPCNVKGIFHENVLSDYITHLPRTIELEDKWEVALVEFHFTKSWYNVETFNMIGVIGLSGSNLREVANERITPGTYQADQLVSEINRILTTITDPTIKFIAPKLEIHQPSKLIRMIPGVTHESHQVLPSLDEELVELLAIVDRRKPDQISNRPKPVDLTPTDPNDKEVIKGALCGVRPFDIERGIHAIYVYSDIVEENLIGDASVHCLRVCTLPKSEFGDTVNLTFEQPHYIPLSKRTFNTIRVTLKDKTNEQIRFRFGETLIKLHLRKC